MNYEEQKIKAVTDYLKSTDVDELISIYNEYASNVGKELIYNNDEATLNDIFKGDVAAAIKAVTYGSYHWPDEYIKFNRYGALDSINEDDVKDHINFLILAPWVISKCPQEIVETLEEILPDIFKHLLESDGVSMDDEDIVDNVIRDNDIIDDNWDEIADKVKKMI